ncbi:MAG: methyltransferase type 11 [Bacteroidetes bacterium 4572_77]|nr:MAG: methyltransferase type 11 [Bacteroidetes bacterium 4572_77]
MKSPNEIKALRPTPIIEELEIVAFERGMSIDYAVEAIMEGYDVLLLDFYSRGLEILKLLKNKISFSESKDYQSSRNNRAVFQKLSQHLLLEISMHNINVKKAPSIGWLKILYPDLEEFLLPYPQVQGLNSAWQWYINGLQIPVLKNKIYPWYATYFPTRFEHLFLFDDYLSNYKGAKQSAIDIGVGSGVLSLQMLQNGFGKIQATDSNPNAIIGMKELKAKENLASLDLYFGHLFAEINEPSELLVFNPPWLPKTQESQGIDAAMYYDENMFEEFFAQALYYMKENGQLVLIFSNLLELSYPHIPHPIKKELAAHNRFKKVQLLQKEVGKASTKTRRESSWRAKELVELWVLEKG